MKTLFVIMMSAVLGVGICITLVATGSVSLKKKDANALKTQPVFHKAQDAMPTKAPVEDTPEAVHKLLPETDQQDVLFEKAVGFLNAAIEKDTGDFEERFERFLKKDQNLDEKMVQRFLKMSFWKNFVTLQNMKNKSHCNAIRLKFAREVELKKAGFAAKGIILMQREIDLAEKELERFVKNQVGGER